MTLVATGFDPDHRKPPPAFGAFNQNKTADQAEDIFANEESPATPFLKEEPTKAVIDQSHIPMVKADPENLEDKLEPNTLVDEDIVGFDLDSEDDFVAESENKTVDKSEPIIETISSQFELDEEDFDKPAFLRKGAKISDRETTDNDDDDSIPAFIKRKL